jgi:hypothetical protein
MRYLIILVLLTSITSQAQWKTYQLTPKGDTLNRVDLAGKKQGPWVVQVPELSGERGYEEDGYYENDQKVGMWRRFSLEGDMIAVENYYFGMKNGKCLYFTNAGEPLREEMWRAIDPKSPYDTIDIRDVNDPSKVVRKEIIKIEPASYKHGTWVYYDVMRGTVEKTEHWVMNKPRVDEATAQANGDELAPIDVTNGDATTAEKKEEKKPLTKPQAILDYEKKNSGKKKTKVRDGQTGG